jgi:hypothetical protein
LIAVEIVRKNPDQVGFAVNPRRWVVERFFAWIGRKPTAGKRLRGYQSTPHAPSSTPHPSCCSCVGSLVLHNFRNRLSAKAEQSSLLNPVSRQQRCQPHQFHGVEMRRLTTIERFSDYRARSDSPQRRLHA